MSETIQTPVESAGTPEAKPPTGAGQRYLLFVFGVLVVAGLAWAATDYLSKHSTPSRLTIFVTGRTMGFLENCGCSGGQAGGMHRRATMIKSTREAVLKPIRSDAGQASETLVLDTGDFSDPTEPRQRLRSEGIVKALEMIGYDAVGVSQNELGYEQEELVELLNKRALLYLCANVKFVKPTTGADKSLELAQLIKPFKVLPLKSGYKVGIIHVIDNSGILRGEPIKSGYEVSDPVEAIAEILDAHSGEAPFWVLTVGSNEGAWGLKHAALQDFEEIKLVYGMRGLQPQNGANGGQDWPQFVEKPQDKGKDVAQTTVTFAEKGQLRVVPIKVGLRADNYKPDPDVQKMIDDMKDDLEQLEEKLWDDRENELEAEELDGPKYLGHTACAGCHRDEALALAGTKHMHAYETLVKAKSQHMLCAKCHNLGFNEQKHSWNVDADKKYTDGDWVMRNVQCENCHGPGEFHVKLRQNNFKDPRLAADGRNAEGLLPATRDTCVKCHDQENSPGFNFEKYWPHIQHGKGLKPKPGSPEGAGMHVESHGEGGHTDDGHSSTTTPTRRSRLIAQLHELL